MLRSEVFHSILYIGYIGGVVKAKYWYLVDIQNIIK